MEILVMFKTGKLTLEQANFFATQSFLNMLFANEDKNLPIAFYNECKNPESKMKDKERATIKNTYGESLITGDDSIPKTAKRICLSHEFTAWYTKLANSETAAPRAGI
jgi:hypothetical protein